MRAKGNAFGVAGWAVGFGGGSLLVPIMFASIDEKTYYVFAALLLYIPIIYAFFPETASRTLEEIDFLFASKSLFTWNEEKEFRKRKAEFERKIKDKTPSQDGQTARKIEGEYIENAHLKDLIYDISTIR